MVFTLTIDQRKKEAKALIEYLQNLPFVEVETKQSITKTAEKDLTPSQKKWVDELKKSIKESKEVATGKRKKQTLKSFLDEI